VGSRSGRATLPGGQKSESRPGLGPVRIPIEASTGKFQSTYRSFDRYVEYTLAVQYEAKTEVALRVLEAIAAHCPVSEHDAFQLRFRMNAEEALIPLDQIAHLILRRESNSENVRTGG
jgi:hypothetical protein